MICLDFELPVYPATDNPDDHNETIYLFPIIENGVELSAIARGLHEIVEPCSTDASGREKLWCMGHRVAASLIWFAAKVLTWAEALPTDPHPAPAPAKSH
jgi:hypothetical protein